MSFFRIPTVIFAFIFSIIAIFPNSVLAETYTSELQAAYGLSAEDALYVSQRMEFEGVTMSDTDKVTEFVSERTSERTSQALVYPTRVTSVRAEESSPGIFKVSFDLKNDGAAQSGIKYRVSLREQSVEESAVEPRTYSQYFPEVVSVLDEDDPEGRLGIAYQKLIPIMIQTIKEQQGEIISLKGEMCSKNENKYIWCSGG